MEREPIGPVRDTKSDTCFDLSARGVIYRQENPLTRDPPCAVGFPADFVWILFQETKVLPVHGHRLSTRKTRPATTMNTHIYILITNSYCSDL